MLSALEIARQAELQPIEEIADQMGIGRHLLEHYGQSVAKIKLEAIEELADRPRARYVVVSAVSPTPFGEGKTGAQRYVDLLKARKAAKIEEVEVLNYTDMFGLYAGYRTPCPGRAMYRLLSGWAHGMEWPQGTAKLEAMKDGPKVPGGGVGRLSANDEMSATYTAIAVRLARTALHELMTYRGLAV